MAYNSGTKYSGGKNQVAGGMASKPVATTTTGKKESLFSTGLFVKKDDAGNPVEGATLASVQIKEAVTLPAGSWINLYQNEPKTPKHPEFSIKVNPGKLKA